MNKIKRIEFLKTLKLMSISQLLNEVNSIKKQLLNCRMQVDYKSKSHFSYLKSNVARVLTIIRHKNVI